jgi:hypothetical protein
LLVVALGLVRSQGDRPPPGSPIRRVDAPAPARPTDPAREAEQRPSPSPSPAAAPAPNNAPSVAAGAETRTPVFDLATLARRDALEPSPDGDRFRTNERFTPGDLAHPERYFETAEHLPELRRDEGGFLPWSSSSPTALGSNATSASRADPVKRAAVLAVIEL